MITAESINNVCKASVHTIVFIPPLKVYIHINKIVTNTEKENGNHKSLNIAIWRTPATKNNLKEAPIDLDNKKKKEPVL